MHEELIVYLYPMLDPTTCVFDFCHERLTLRLIYSSWWILPQC